MVYDPVALSIVIPVYNSAGIFPTLYDRLVAALQPAVESFEVIAVVDGTVDGSAEVVAGFCETDSRIKLIEFSRNFGHQTAVTAGLQHTSGEMVIVMDDDLEDPPEILADLIAKANEGFDVVYGIRRRRKVSALMQGMYHLFYRFINLMSIIEMPYDSGDFCLMKRPVVDALNEMPENNRYIRGMRAWVGFEQTGVEYERGSRHSGDSGYNLVKYFRFALDGILSFSYRPLEYVSAVGFLTAAISIILGLRLLLLKLLDRVRDVPGWTSLTLIVLFLGGMQLIAIGVTGQYIARIYDEVKDRPQYVIKRQIGFDKDDSETT